jgi:hypothetical protein
MEGLPKEKGQQPKPRTKRTRERERERERELSMKSTFLGPCVVGSPFVCARTQEGFVGRLENPSCASGPEKGGGEFACERERPKLFAETLG